MTLSRREFIAAASAATVGFAAAPRLTATPRLAAPPPMPNDFGEFTVAIQSYTFRNFKPLEKALARIQAVGVTNGEFFRDHIPTTSSPEQIKAALKLCSEYHVKPVAFGVESFSKNHEANKKKFEFGAALGIKSLSADPDPDSFDSLDKLVEEYKINIAIHPHGPQGRTLHRWYSAEKILAAVKDHNPLIGTCIDTGHLIRSEQLGKKLDPVQQIKLMGARNFGIHLKDHDNKRKTDVVFGDPTGQLDVPGVLKALKEVKFKGHISIEYEAHPQDPTKDVMACLAYLKKCIKEVG
ncbi:MAG TPA: sugar phosphate isomerase/epimerase [Fimbriiglobus sp.]|jgi:sugar phosphate isomerase/epimerase